MLLTMCCEHVGVALAVCMHVGWSYDDVRAMLLWLVHQPGVSVRREELKGRLAFEYFPFLVIVRSSLALLAGAACTSLRELSGHGPLHARFAVPTGRT